MLTPDQERRLDALRDSLTGQVLPGSDGSTQYPLRERIGEGGQGWVFRATWNGSVDVVVKVLRPEHDADDSLARFRREAQVLRALSQQVRPNPHVVRFFDHAYATVRVAATGDTWTLPFTVMEFVSGVTLEQALAREAPRGLTLERARRFLRHVVLALRDVHAQNVVHRDLKPSNILVETTTAREIAKVTDFGLAKLVDAGMQRTTGLAGATVGYAPPEQFERGNLRVGKHTDVFSLAAIFYEMVSGTPAFPFNESDHPAIVLHRILAEARPALARIANRLPNELAERPDVVAALDAELARALSPEPTHRHATVGELHDGIERALTSLAATPSLPFTGSRAGLSVHPAAAPPSVHPSAAPTMLADDRGDLVSRPPPGASSPAAPLAQASSPRVSGLPPQAGDLVWRRVTPPTSPRPFDSVAIHRGGDVAVAVGPAGPAHWTERAGWTRVVLPAEIDVAAMRTATWVGRHAFWAGASELAVAVAPDGACAVWHFGLAGLVFHGAYADGAGILLAGERATPHGAVGVVGEIFIGTRAPRPRVLEIVGTGPLRAVARLGQNVVACGDGGILALADERESRFVRACDAPLLAMLALADGTAAVVGGGGFAFRVSARLEAHLEAVQTTKELCAVAQAPDGTLWCAGAEQRVLRRDAHAWVRAAATGGQGRVRGLHASAASVLAFGDDGSVFDGRPR